MAGRRRSDRVARDNAVEQERRARERRERDRRRANGAPPSQAGERRLADRRSVQRRGTERAGGAVVATRERHEGLVGWAMRTIASVPTTVARLPGLLVASLRSFALEVVAVVAGIGRGILRAVPGGSKALERMTSSPARTRRSSGSSAAPARRSLGQRRIDAERRERLRARMRLLLVAALVVAVGAAWVFVPASDAFRIRHVEVSGASAVDDLDVRERIDPLLAGKTVFTVDEDALRQRIEQLPFVREARVERHLPGGLELHVVEYRPLALAFGDGSFWLVAQDGRILARAKGGAWKGRIPTVELRGRGLEPGDRLDDEPGLQLLDVVPGGSTLAFDVIRADDYLLEAELVDGVKVRFGRPVDLRLKVAALERTLYLAGRHGHELLYVDVSVPGRSFYCPTDDLACHLPRGPVDADAADDAAASATTPEETGGDEADVTDVTG